MPGGPFLVCGLARSGQAAAKALAALGHRVIAVDAASPKGASALADFGVEVHLDSSGLELLNGIETLVKSPGVPQSAPVVAAARNAKIGVIGEFELGWILTDGPVIAVTGTNGKTTCSEMIGHILRSAGVDSTVAGNVGTPLTGLVGTPQASGSLVLEASSFQLEDSRAFAPEIAVILNITADHIDRHGSVQAYRDAKLRILANQSRSDYAVLPDRFEAGESIAAQTVRFGGPESDISEIDGYICWHGEPLIKVGSLQLPGQHNQLNAQASAAACLLHGVDPELVSAALLSFEGVAHRLETVAVDRDVRWVNDSKATNVEAAITALRVFDSPVHLIAGGEGKGQDFAPLIGPIEDHCASVHLIGDSADQLAELLATASVPTSIDGTLESAVQSCASLASAGEVVLLAPACASFDQFADFEDRGDSFRELVGGRAS